MYLKYFLLADMVSQDTTGKLNIFGIFDSIASLTFPTRHRELTLVAQIEAQQTENGPHKILIEFRDEDDNKLFGLEQDVDLPTKSSNNGMLKGRIILRVQDLIFKKPGQYHFIMFDNNRFLGRAFISVTKPEVSIQGQ